MPDTLSGRIEALCVSHGLRMTDQRRIIARVLSEAKDHPDVEELHHRAAAIDKGISIATVYRTVRLFEESGILERHDFRDGRSRYEEAGIEHHDHLIDMKTGRVLKLSVCRPKSRVGWAINSGITVGNSTAFPSMMLPKSTS
jgi:Fur family transcriptional regulator, ferric uptake regulator